MKNDPKMYGVYAFAIVGFLDVLKSIIEKIMS